MFNAGRAVGKGVKYLTQLGSKIGKRLKSGASSVGRNIGRDVDRLGAGTRKTQAAAIKGARGVRDAANAAGNAGRRAVRDARAGYETGRHGGMRLSDLKPYNKPVSNLDNVGRYKATGKARDKIYSDAAKFYKPKSKVATPEDMAAAQARANPYKNYMTKQKPKSSGGIINKPPRPPGQASRWCWRLHEQLWRQLHEEESCRRLRQVSDGWSVWLEEPPRWHHHRCLHRRRLWRPQG
jgi:hypothetical protein